MLTGSDENWSAKNRPAIAIPNRNKPTPYWYGPSAPDVLRDSLWYFGFLLFLVQSIL